MTTLLARTRLFLAIKQSLPACGCVQFRGGGACTSSVLVDPPLNIVVSVPDTNEWFLGKCC